MTSFYESATSGLNYDRFSSTSGVGGNVNMSDDFFNDSTLTKMKQHFWTAKQLFRSKFGKKEDAFLLASDAEFDTKLSLYLAISDTTKKLLSALEDYHHYTDELLDCEVDLANFLSQESVDEKEHLQKVMRIAGRCIDVASKQRKMTIRPLICMYHDLDMFNERAIADCQSTVEAAERARTEYRGSLLWIKSVSEELDPSSSAQMENYRKTQTVVRLNKEKFDALKCDTFQKVDVLAQCRSTLLVDLARQLFDAVGLFYEHSARTYEKIFAELDGIDSYEIDVLKILNDPIGLALEHQKQAGNSKTTKLLQNENGKLSQQKRRSSPTSLQKQQKDQFENDIVELEDIEVGKIVTDVFDLNLTKNDITDEPSTSNLINLENARDQNLENLTNRSSSICSSTALFRAESPLGILDDQEENGCFTDPVMSSNNSLNDIFKVGNTAKPINVFGEVGTTPKLEPPPSLNKIKSSDLQQSTLDFGLFDINLTLEADHFSARQSLFNQTDNSVLNLHLPASSSLSSGGTRNVRSPKPKDTNWSNFLAQELDEALNFGTTKNSSSLM